MENVYEYDAIGSEYFYLFVQAVIDGKSFAKNKCVGTILGSGRGRVLIS